ncbi:MAG: alpha-L-arabinofuranosidase C-terminal domain-containing protein [Chthoniobacteraceae bacterium]
MKAFWGVPVKPGTTYRASFFAKGSANAQLRVGIQSADGTTTYAQTAVTSITSDWKRYTMELTTAQDAPALPNGRFVITTTQPGTYWFNLVSLFPPTFKDRPNGNRVDLMQELVDLKPAFLRCPGGNYLEGESPETHFVWKQTLGDISERPGHMGTWGYRSSDGMGLLEFMEWAEDMGSEPVLAVYAGYSLPSKEHRGGITVPTGDAMKPYVEEALDEIEYVTGGPETKWGARRIADGHPQPFSLQYVEIGNEDFVGDAKKTYDARFAQFYDAIKAKYPQLQCIATIPVKSRKADVLDEHHYATSVQMMDLAHRYDKFDRNGPKIFVGEWATRELVQTGPDGTVQYNRMPWSYKEIPTPSLHAALGDAAFLTGMERNADLIVMNCYAPLFVHDNPGAYQWSPNLIGYDSLRSYVSPAYYVQKMFSDHRGDSTVNQTLSGEPKTFFANATVDHARGVVYVKVVNLAMTEQALAVKLDGATAVDSEAEATILTAPTPGAVNSLTQPDNVKPTTTKLTGLGAEFSHTFPANSLTIIALKTK